jgi:hypothetical protein
MDVTVDEMAAAVDVRRMTVFGRKKDIFFDRDHGQRTSSACAASRVTTCAWARHTTRPREQRN